MEHTRPHSSHSRMGAHGLVPAELRLMCRVAPRTFCWCVASYLHSFCAFQHPENNVPVWLMERSLSRVHWSIKIKSARLSLGYTGCHLPEKKKKIFPASSVFDSSLLLGCLSACIDADSRPEGLQMCAEVQMHFCGIQTNEELTPPSSHSQSRGS